MHPNFIVDMPVILEVTDALVMLIDPITFSIYADGPVLKHQIRLSPFDFFKYLGYRIKINKMNPNALNLKMHKNSKRILR